MIQNRIEVDETGHSFERKYTQYIVAIQDCLFPKTLIVCLNR